MSVGRWIGAAAAAGAAVGLGLLLLGGPGAEARAANGTYWNDCCGTVELRDGRMVLGEKPAAGKQVSVGFVVERDSAGPYVLPERFVGTWEDNGFEVDGSRPPLKLRLDALPGPSRIELPSVRGSYSFERQPAKARRPG
jgi:hypothetical protein